MIHATFDPKSTSFSGLVTLTMRGGLAPETLSVQREDLIDPKQETIRIERANVATPDGVSLVNDASREMRVTVSNVTRPGDFGGKLILSCAGRPNVRADLRLVVMARARPELRSVSPSVNYSLLRCRQPFCRVWDLFTPPPLRGDKRDALVQNLGSDSVTLGPTLLTLRGDKTGFWPSVGASPAELQLSVPGTVNGRSTQALSMKIDRRALLPDRYQGNLVVRIEGSDDPTTVGVTLDVRDGPGPALLAIVVGILIGRLLQRMATPAAQARHRLFELHQRVAEVATRVTEPVSATFLARRLRAERTRIEAASADEEKAITDRLNTLRHQAQLLFDIQSLDALARRSVAGSLPADLAVKLSDARDLTISCKFEEATAKSDEIQNELEKATAAAAAADALALRTQRQPAVADTPEEKARPASVARRRLSTFLKFLAGSFAREEATDYPIVRPLVRGIVLAVLVLIGFHTLYITSGSTFGSAGVYDYLGLFLWGVSADVAQATLQNLPRRI